MNRKVLFALAIVLVAGITMARELPRPDEWRIAPNPGHAQTPSLVTLLDGPGFMVDTSRFLTFPPTQQTLPDVAFDGTNYFVVWGDWQLFGVWGARVAPDGAVLDPVRINIDLQTEDLWPAVSFDGENYLVVWGTETGVRGARVATTGGVLDSTGFDIFTGEYMPMPAIGFDGANFLVVWHQDFGDSTATLGARVSPAGVVLDTPAFRISAATGWHGHPAIAFDGANFLVTWYDCRNDSGSIYGARVTPSGAVLDPDGFGICTRAGGQFEPDVSFDGVNYLVVWLDRVGQQETDIYGARVTPGGTVLDPAGIAISTAPGVQENPAVEFDGANYFVEWLDGRGDGVITGARLTPAGNLLDTAGILISDPLPYPWNPAIGFDGANYLTLWSAHTPNNQGECIYGARVRPDGTRPDTEDIALGFQASDQVEPRAGFDGTNYLVVWHEPRWLDDYQVRAARLTPSGTTLDPTGIAISSENANAWANGVAFGGTNYLVVWEQGDDAYGARVTPSGTVLDPGGFVISAAADRQGWPSVSSNGTNFLVTWGTGGDIYCARVSQAGTVLDTHAIRVGTGANGYNSTVSFDGTNFLVVWCGSYVRAARVTPSGQVLDPTGIRVSSSPPTKWYPSVSFDGANSMVFWCNELTGSGNIVGARVSPAGVVLDTSGIIIEENASGQALTRVAFNGTDHIVAWANNSNIAGAQVSTAGAVLDRFTRTPRRADWWGGPEPTLAHGNGNQVLMAYPDFTLRAGGKWYSANRIWGTFSPFDAVAEPGPLIRPGGAGLSVWPNPFRDRVWFNIGLGTGAEPSELRIFDVTGTMVRELAVTCCRASGPQTLVWDGTDNHGRMLPGGVYFARLDSGGEVERRALLLLR